MTNNDLTKIEECREFILSNIANLQKFIPALIPINSDDKKIIEIGNDMLTCLCDDLKDYNNPIGLILDVDTICEEWIDIKQKLCHPYDRTVMDMYYELIGEFEDDERDDG